MRKLLHSHCKITLLISSFLSTSLSMAADLPKRDVTQPMLMQENSDQEANIVRGHYDHLTFGRLALNGGFGFGLTAENDLGKLSLSKPEDDLFYLGGASAEYNIGLSPLFFVGLGVSGEFSHFSQTHNLSIGAQKGQISDGMITGLGLKQETTIWKDAEVNGQKAQFGTVFRNGSSADTTLSIDKAASLFIQTGFVQNNLLFGVKGGLSIANASLRLSVPYKRINEGEGFKVCEGTEQKLIHFADMIAPQEVTDPSQILIGPGGSLFARYAVNSRFDIGLNYTYNYYIGSNFFDDKFSKDQTNPFNWNVSVHKVTLDAGLRF